MTSHQIDDRSGVAVWRQIEEALRKDISDAVYKPGQKMPTEAQMADRFGVNRHTVRRAMGMLAAAGLVRVEQGRGAFVQEEAVDYPLGPKTRFTSNIHAAHRLPGRRIIRAEIVPAEKEVAKSLRLAKGDDVVLIESISDVDGRPVCYASTYLPAWRFPEAIQHIMATRSITKTLALFGVTDYSRASTRIAAHMPKSEVSRHLQLPPGKPVVQTDGLDVDLSGSPVSYNISQFAGERVHLVVEG